MINLNKDKIKVLAKSTIRLLRKIEKRLLNNNLNVGLAIQMTDIQLKKSLNYEGSEKSFRALKRNIKTLYESGNYLKRVIQLDFLKIKTNKNKKR